MGNRNRRQKRRALVVTALAGAVAPIAPPAVGAALPTVTFDLRVHDTGGKEATVSHVGDSVLLDLYAFASGLDLDLTNDRVTSASGAIRSSTGGLLGDLLGLPAVAPFNMSGANVGTQRDVDGDGDMDVSGVGTSSVGYYAFRTDPLAAFVQPPGGSWVGQTRFTVTSVTDAATEINWFNRTVLTSLISILDGAPMNYQPTKVTVGSAAPVVIRGVPSDVQYLSGVIDTHVTATGTVQPTPGSTVILTRGADVTAGANLDLRDSGAGGGFGAHELRVNDLTSGNAGGTLIVGALSVATTDAGRFVQSAGSTGTNTVVIGAGGNTAAADASMEINGGSFSTNNLTVGGSSPGRFVQTNGVATPLLVRVGTSPGAAGSVAQSRRRHVHRVAGPARRHQRRRRHLPPGRRDQHLRAAGPHRRRRTRAVRNVRRAAHRSGVLPRQQRVGRRRGVRRAADRARRLPRLRGHAPHALHRLGHAARRHLHPDRRDAGVQHDRRRRGGFGTYIFEGGTTSNIRCNVYNSGDPANGAARLEIRSGTFKPSALKLGLQSAFGETGVGTAVQSGGVNAVSALDIFPGSTYTLTGGTMDIGGGVIYGTLDLSHTATTVNTWGWLTFYDPASLRNAQQASFIAGPKSLLRFPAGFDPLTQIGHIEGLVQVAGQPLTIPPSNALGGNGTIEGNVTNNGTVAPGNSPGAIAIEGNYTQAGDAALAMEIAGPAADQFDVLSVTGQASLDGFLNVALLDGYVPPAGSSFTILTAAAVTGAFDNVVNGHVAFAGGQFDVTYAATSVTLSNFSSVPEPGCAGLLMAAAFAAASPRRRRTIVP
jgi:hypothetical protein